MTKEAFKPKDAETLKSEILDETGLEYEGNEEVIDKLVARGLKDEEYKASMHADKNKHLDGKRAKEELLKKAGIDPETGEKLDSKDSIKPSGMDFRDVRALQDVHDEDIDEVMEFAKFKGISVAEAKKLPVVQTLLRTHAEERATAMAASTNSSKRSSKSGSSGDILKRAESSEGESMSAEERQEAVKAMIERMKTKK